MNSDAPENVQLAELARALGDVTRKMEWLMDRAAIQDVLNSYARAIDRTDLEVLKAVYHNDATDEHGMFSGTGHEFAEFVVPHIRSKYLTMQHHHTTTSIDIRDDEASAETYFLCVQLSPDNDLEFCGGRNVDRFEKRDGRWGIAHRQVVMDWTEYAPKVQSVEIDPLFVKGNFCDLDISYRVIPKMRLGGFYDDRHPGSPSDR